MFESVQALELYLGDPTSPAVVGGVRQVMQADEAEMFPRPFVDTLLRWGFFEYFIPWKLGGKLHSFDELLALCYVVARRDLTTAIAIGQTMLGALPVWLGGSLQQQQALVRQLRAGTLGCLALTEKQHGSDLLSTETTAVQCDDTLQLTGSKWLINNASQGGHFTLLARVDSASSRGLQLLWIDKSHCSGLRTLDKISTHGIRGADISGLKLDGCRVSLQALFPGTEPGIYTTLKALQVSRILCSGFSLGAANTCLQLTLDFAVQRQLYGKSMLQIPMVQWRLVSAFCQLQLSAAVAFWCARAIQRWPAQLSLWSAVCKYYVPVQVEAQIRELKVLLGARHYLRQEHADGLFQKMMRDHEVVALFDGSTEVNLSAIAAQCTAIAARLQAFVAEPQSEAVGKFSLVDDTLDDALLDPTRMQLSNQGQDVLMQDFLQATAAGEHDFKQRTAGCAAEMQQLRLDLLSWIQSLTTQESSQLLPADSIQKMALARQYCHLFAKVCISMQWADLPVAKRHHSVQLMQLILRGDTPVTGNQEQHLQAVLPVILDNHQRQQPFYTVLMQPESVAERAAS